MSLLENNYPIGVMESLGKLYTNVELHLTFTENLSRGGIRERYEIRSGDEPIAAYTLIRTSRGVRRIYHGPGLPGKKVVLKNDSVRVSNSK